MLTAPMPGRPSDPGWNELQFLSWSEFTDMAPSIIGLEAARLGKVIASSPPTAAYRNGLVHARFELQRFIRCLKGCEKGEFEAACAHHLRGAVMTLSIQTEILEPTVRATCAAVLDRLNYVHDRLHLIY